GCAAVEQCELQHFFHVLDEVELHVALDRLGDIDQITLVELGQNDGADFGRARREHFLFYAADRQDVASQSDLAGHGYISLDRPTGDHRDDRRSDRDPGGRAIFRNGARGNVNVHVVIFKIVAG